MTNFIELHDPTGTLITISINHICSYTRNSIGTDISLSNGLHFTVAESPKEIKCAIIDAKNSMTSQRL